MPLSEALPSPEPLAAEVLTLPEAAAYLRVPEEALLELVDQRHLPAQRIGGEWRFLKGAVQNWLRYGSDFRRELRMFPTPWFPDHPIWEDFFRALEQRILSKIPERLSSKPGSKEAVLRHFGVFKDSADLDEQLAGIRARREASGE